MAAEANVQHSPRKKCSRKKHPPEKILLQERIDLIFYISGNGTIWRNVYFEWNSSEMIMKSDNFQLVVLTLFSHAVAIFFNLWPAQVKDMRNHGDETARITMLHLLEGEDPPPGMRKDFEQVGEKCCGVGGKMSNSGLSKNFRLLSIT